MGACRLLSQRGASGGMGAERRRRGLAPSTTPGVAAPLACSALLRLHARPGRRKEAHNWATSAAWRLIHCGLSRRVAQRRPWAGETTRVLQSTPYSAERLAAQGGTGCLAADAARATPPSFANKSLQHESILEPKIHRYTQSSKPSFQPE
jgi:hypothetical protein